MLSSLLKNCWENLLSEVCPLKPSKLGQMTQKSESKPEPNHAA